MFRLPSAWRGAVPRPRDQMAALSVSSRRLPGTVQGPFCSIASEISLPLVYTSWVNADALGNSLKVGPCPSAGRGAALPRWQVYLFAATESLRGRQAAPGSSPRFDIIPDVRLSSLQLVRATRWVVSGSRLLPTYRNRDLQSGSPPNALGDCVSAAGSNRARGRFF